MNGDIDIIIVCCQDSMHYVTAEPSISARPCSSTTVSTMSGGPQAEGLCLRFPENLPPHANLSHDVAVQMLGRAISLATQIAFQPSYIDKPPGAASPLGRASPFLTRLQMAKSIFFSSLVASISHKTASGIWSTSNDTPSLSRADAYVTGLPTVRVCISHTHALSIGT